MLKNKKKSITVIVPAYNEEKNIESILSFLSSSPLINQIIVVDDGSIDKTAVIVKTKFPQIKLIKLNKNQGKGNALLAGVKEARNNLLFFCDADFTGLRHYHLHQLIQPVLDNKARLTVGMPEKMNVLLEYSWYRKLVDILGNKKESKWQKFRLGLGGAKVLFKKDFFLVPSLKNTSYKVEYEIINYYRSQNWLVKCFILKGVGHLHKIKKWGIIKGVIRDVKAYLCSYKQFLFSKSF